MRETEDDTNKWRISIFIDWKNSCYLNAHITLSHLQIHCKLYQNSSDNFQKNGNDNSKVYRETITTPNCKGVWNKRNESGVITLTYIKLCNKQTEITARRCWL